MTTTSLKKGQNIMPMISITILFFMWGFITSLNDILIPFLKEIYSLSHFEANIVQFAFFIAYFVGAFAFYILSLKKKDPISKWGYKTTIVIGLVISSIACSLFAFAAYKALSFSIFLCTLFCLGLGLTFLQIAANPFVAIIGEPQTASSRLNLSQAFNSLGTTLGPALGGYLIFTMFKPEENQGPSTVVIPYLVLAGLLLLVAIFIYFSKINTTIEEETSVSKKTSIWSKPYTILGALGIFFYVGAEVAVGSNIVSYLKETMQMDEALASAYLSYYWGGAMIGRFLGSVSLSSLKIEKKLLYMLLLAATGFAIIFFINNSLHGLSFEKVWIFLLFIALNFVGLFIGKGKTARSLAIFAFVNVCLIVLSLSINSPLVIWTLLAIGLFNSIMWSNVFTLAIDGLKEQTSQVSSMLIMMIVGGAVLPPLQGLLADATNISISFLIPMVSYAYLFFYGIKGFKIGKK